MHVRHYWIVGAFVAAYAVLPAVAHAEALGQVTSFHADSVYDITGATTLSATLRAVGTHAYFYVDDRVWASASSEQRTRLQQQLDSLSGAFDSTVWPKATVFWGLPFATADPHITILIEQMLAGDGGYFRGIDHYPPSQVPESNGREMVYVSVAGLQAGVAPALLAHEFQHLISFNQKEILQNTSDDTWLNEARSEYDITVTGYNTPFENSTLQQRLNTFLHNATDSLVQWPNTAVDYAIATMFAHYLTDRFGPSILQSTIHTPQAGVAAINEWLAVNNPSEQFGDVFVDWMVASYLNDRTIGPAYGYTTAGLDTFHVIPQSVTNVTQGAPVTASFSVGEWQPVWFQYIPTSYNTTSPTLTVAVSGASSAQWGGAYVADYGIAHTVGSWRASSGSATLAVPVQSNGARLKSLTFMVTQGTNQPVGSRTLVTQPVTLVATLGSGAVVAPILISTPTPTPPSAQPHDGDLIERAGQSDIYVVWGPYRRYLSANTLALYGFQNRSVLTVSDEVFFSYRASNYIREVSDQKVYAVWPDNTKHWLHITAAQWDASSRDWDAIFTVNGAETASYQTGEDIQR